MQIVICMKYQLLFSRKNKKNISKCRLLKFLPIIQKINPYPAMNIVKRNISDMEVVTSPFVLESYVQSKSPPLGSKFFPFRLCHFWKDHKRTRLVHSYLKKCLRWKYGGNFFCPTQSPELSENDSLKYFSYLLNSFLITGLVILFSSRDNTNAMSSLVFTKSIKITAGVFYLLMLLTLVLLNPDMLCLCKQCRSRSVGFWRSQLIWICTVCHSVFEFTSTTWIK